MDLFALLATLALLGVTFWYAKTTKDMANIAKTAAEASDRATAAAERSAQAARDAATVAQSQIRPDFKGRLVAVVEHDDHGKESGHTACLHIKAVGDAVVIQAVRVRRAFRKKGDGHMSGKAELVDQFLSPLNDESALPRRLHYGETILLTHAGLDEDNDEPEFDRFILDIEYTFSEDGSAGATRELIVDTATKW